MVEDKVVTTEGVSCITTQTTQNSRNVHFLRVQEKSTGCSDNGHVYTQVVLKNLMYTKGYMSLNFNSHVHKGIHWYHVEQVTCTKWNTWVPCMKSRL